MNKDASATVSAKRKSYSDLSRLGSAQISELPLPLDNIQRLVRRLAEISDQDALVVMAAEKRQRVDLRMWSAHRGSERIGVTRNSNKWQALIMIGDRKRYIGTYAT